MNDLERMISGRLYNPAAPELTAARLRARRLADRFNRTRAWQFKLRSRLISKLFPNASDKSDAFFEPSIRVEYGFNVRFGKCFFMNFDCQLLDVAPITIGDDVMFGPRVTLATPMHPFLIEERKFQSYPDGEYDLEYAKPIVIGDGVWLAASVTVCGGVTIGAGSVIAAGSVVTRDIPAGVLAGGVPCKVIRPLTDADRMKPWDTYCAARVVGGDRSEERK